MAQARLVLSPAPQVGALFFPSSMPSSPGAAERAVAVPAPGGDRRRGAALCRPPFPAMFSMPSSAIRSRACCARCGPAASGISTAPRSPRSRSCASCCPRPRSISCTRSSRAPAIRAAFARLRRDRFRVRQRATSWQRSCRRRCRSGWSASRRCLGLFVRLAVAQGRRVYDLSGKFGAPAGRGGRAAACGAAARRAARHRLSCRLAMPRSASLCAGDGAGRRGDRALPASRSTSSMSAAGFRSAIPTSCRRRSAITSRAIDGCRGAALPAMTCGCGPSRAGRWSPAAGRSSCRCSCGAAMRSTSTTASTAA